HGGAFQRIVCRFALILAIANLTAAAEELVRGRKSLVLENSAARLVIDLAGGSIGEFRFRGSELNPLSWAHPGPEDVAIHGFGHCLCLDRWGPPSQAEGARGMPYHGEAAYVPWQLVREAGQWEGVIEAQMSAALPKAGLLVRRTIRMSAKAAVCAVREEVKN